MYDQRPVTHVEFPATACPNGYSVAADVVVPKRAQMSLRSYISGLPNPARRDWALREAKGTEAGVERQADGGVDCFCLD